MKPTFALDLTADSIGLLHRTPKGWMPLGEVPFAAADLTEALDYLRKTALGLSPLGIATKIVIPNDQILYTEIEAPGPTRDEKRRQIEVALEGVTPYDVADLVFDWSGRGNTLKVAVVPKETLAQAESFATEHRLNPVSFVAVPDEGTFVNEAWFGPTEASATILADGETVDRDREAIVRLDRELPKPEAAANVTPAPETVDEPPPEVDPDLLAQPVSADAAPENAAPVADFDAGEGGKASAISEVDAAEAADGKAADGDRDAQSPDPNAPEAQKSAPAEDRDTDPAFADADATASAAQPPAADADEAPFAEVQDNDAFPESDDEFASQDETEGLAASAATPETDDADLPPAPSSAAMLAFASRRSSAALGAALPDTGPLDPVRALRKPIEDLPPLPRPTGAPTVAVPLPGPAPSAIGTLRNGAARADTGLAAAPSIPGTKKFKGKAGPAPVTTAIRPMAPGAKPLTQPGGTFGASKTRGKPRYLGMVLTALLLIFLALIAAWSSLVISSNSRPSSDTAVAIAEGAVPGIDDEMLADQQDPQSLSADETGAVADPTVLAGSEVLPADLLTGAPAAEVADAMAADAVVDAQPVAEHAPDTTMTTEMADARPLAEAQDEIFLAAMDAPPPALDALALPLPQSTADPLPAAQMPPPPFGTVYQFDANGMLKPTVEGILSPEGVMLIAGKPPIVPPERSAAAASAALAAAAVTVPVVAAEAGVATENLVVPDAIPPPADPALAGFRPRPRPEGLRPATQDDATLTEDSSAPGIKVRPLARPKIVLASAQAADLGAQAADLGAQAASLQAQGQAALAAASAAEAANPSIVAISRRPAARPRDLSRAVEAAVAAAVREPVAQPTLAAAAKPEELDDISEPELASNPAPKIPTKASVAKQATFVNAINLSKTNLIGVYGTPSSRYALIRQSNGRYKKVKVGDRIDGGTVQAITQTEVRYQKGGRLLSLAMPKG